MMRRRFLIPDSNYVTSGLIFWLDGLERGNTTNTWTDKIGNNQFTLSNVVEVSNGVEFAGTATSMGGCDIDCFSNINSVNDITIEFCITEYSNASTNVFILEPIGSPKPCAHLSGDRTVFTNAGGVNRASGLTRSIPMVISMNNLYCIQNGISKELFYTTLNTGQNTNQTTIGLREGNTKHPFKGIIHSIRVYNRQLSSSEIINNQKLDNNRYSLGLNI